MQNVSTLRRSNCCSSIFAPEIELPIKNQRSEIGYVTKKTNTELYLDRLLSNGRIGIGETYKKNTYIKE